MLDFEYLLLLSVGAVADDGVVMDTTTAPTKKRLREVEEEEEEEHQQQQQHGGEDGEKKNAVVEEDNVEEEEEEEGELGEVEEEEEEDDDDDEEDEEEEGGGGGGGSTMKKQKRRRVGDAHNPFIDDVADVDDEEEEEEEAEEGFEDAVEGVEEEQREGGHAAARNATRELDARDGVHRDAEGNELTDEQLHEYITDRYARLARDTGGYGRGKQLRNMQVTQSHMRYKEQARNPTKDDPYLWVVRCKPGKEREACACLMQKAIDLCKSPEPLKIISVSAQDHLQGYLYIEARKESHVRHAIQGMNIIFKRDVKIVPIGERVDCMRTNKKASVTAKPGSFVRVKMGTYKGDLAKVVSINHQNSMVTLKVLPRLDYEAEKIKVKKDQLKNQRFATEDERDTCEELIREYEKRPRSERPVPKPFNQKDAENNDLPVDTVRDQYTSETLLKMNEHVFSENYLLKTVNLRTVVLETQPSFEELQTFNTGSVAPERESATRDEIARTAQSIAPKATKFVRGDVIIVSKGDMKNLRGTVTKVENDRVRIRPDVKFGLNKNTTVEVAVADIEKWFKTGNRVKVIAGQHSGDTGLVMKVDAQKKLCTILSDVSKLDIEVFSSCLVLESKGGVTAALERFGNYRIGDLVTIGEGGQKFGVIIKVQHDACQIILNTSSPEKTEVMMATLSDIARRVITKSSQAHDIQMSPISVADMVEIAKGECKGVKGLVKHIYRGMVFMISKEKIEHGGYTVARARSCMVAGGRGVTARATKVLNPGMTPSMASPFHGGMQSPGHGVASPNPYSQMPGSPSPYQQQGYGQTRSSAGSHRNNPLINKEVKIRSGTWKGYLGRIISIDDVNAKVELTAQENRRIVTVPRSKLPSQYHGIDMSNPFISGMANPHFDITRDAYNPQMNTNPFAKQGIPPTPFRGQGIPPTPYRGDGAPSAPLSTQSGGTRPPAGPQDNPGYFPTPEMVMAQGQTPSSSLMPPSSHFDGYRAPSGGDPRMPPGYDARMTPSMGTPSTPGGLGVGPSPGAGADPYNVRTAGTGIGTSYSLSVGTANMNENAQYGTPAYTPNAGAMTPYDRALTPGTTVSTPGMAPANAGAYREGEADRPDALLLFVGLLVRRVKDGPGGQQYVVTGLSADRRALVLASQSNPSDTDTLRVHEIRVVRPTTKNDARLRIISGPDAGVEGEAMNIDEGENEAILKIVDASASVDVKMASLDLVGIVVGASSSK